MNLEEKLSNVVRRHEEIEALLSSNISPDEMVKLNKELSSLTPIVEAIKDYQKHLSNFNDAKEMMDDASLDKDMRDMAEIEFYDLKEKLPAIEKNIKVLLV